MGRASREARRKRAERIQNAAASPPPPPPPSKIQRLRRRFGGWPGAGLGVGAIQMLWRLGTMLFRRGEDADFALDLWRSAGGDVPMLVQAVSSPIFGLALVLVSVSYAFFGKEPNKKIPVHPAVPIVGWAVVILCGVLTGSVFLFDAFVQTSNISQIVEQVTGERHVTESQKAKIKDIIGPVASTFPRALSVAAADNPEANAYAIELMIAFGQAGLKIETLDPHTLIPRPMRALSPNVKGVFFEVHDPNNLPQEVTILSKALQNAGIPPKFYTTPQLGPDNYLLTVGLK